MDNKQSADEIVKQLTPMSKNDMALFLNTSIKVIDNIVWRLKPKSIFRLSRNCYLVNKEELLAELNLSKKNGKETN